MTTEQPPLEDFFSNRAFDVVMRGYARNQVDDYVGQVESSVKHLRDHNTELQGALQTAQKRATEQSKPSYAGLGSRAEQLLRLAEEESTDLVQRARTEAEQLREEIVGKAKSDAEASEKRRAQQQADLAVEIKRKREEIDREVEERRKASTAEAEERRKTSAADAERAVGEARKKAEQLVRLAKEDADRIRTEADAHAEKIKTDAQRQIAELDERKDSINSQMEQLRALLGSASPVRVGERMTKPNTEDGARPATASSTTAAQTGRPASAGQQRPPAQPGQGEHAQAQGQPVQAGGAHPSPGHPR